MKAIIAAALLVTAAFNAPAHAVGAYGGFPDVAITAKSGEYVLVPSWNWIEAGAGPDAHKTSFIFYHQKMIAPAVAASTVQFMREQHEVPNSYIVAIAAGGRANAGDIVLTWWQSGSGMQRAIVVRADDPARPVVRYLDIAYDNPAKSPDKSTTIGRMDEALAVDSFVPLMAGAPGSIFRCLDAGKPVRRQLIAQAADGRQLMSAHAGRLAIHAPGECESTPLKPDVQPGAMAWVEFAGTFVQARVTRIEPAIGRVFVELFGKERAIAFGDVIP